MGRRLVSVRRMIRDVLEDQLSLNSKLPRTLLPLLFRPGFLTRQYFAGRIARYIRPFRLYLISSLLFFIVLPFIADFDRLWRAIEPHVEEAQRSDATTGTPGREPERSEPASRPVDERGDQEPFALVRSNIDTTAVPGWLRPIAEYYVRQEAKINAMSPREGTRVLYEKTFENVPRAIFLLLPLFALFLKVLYWRRLYAEHLVFALHFHALLFLLATITVMAESLVVLQVLTMAVLVYLFAALKVAYGQSWVWTAVKFSVLVVLYFFVFVYAVSAVIFLTVLTI